MAAGLIISHPDMLQHDPGAGHPEAPSRLQAVWQALAEPEFQNIERIDAPLATRADLERAHDPQMVAALFAAAPSDGWTEVDGDTVMSTGSLRAAQLAAGAAIAGIDALISGRVQRVFAAVRPPGHHATRREAMGFCLFNNIAIAAHAALARGIQRLAIIDFDVHHGNGTQDIVENDPRILYVSSHQWPLYPGTGSHSETGVGNIVNIELPAGTASMHFRELWREQALVPLRAFAPELLLVSAGFDAHRLDPLANLNLVAEDYAWLTRELLALPSTGGRMLSMLEGGYSLTALYECTRAHAGVMFG
ncbi:acetoin utilization protein [Ahniella affigens]|uniref:Acetoin utilization protein n=1 Tax=Ahniella affigens TaxID=2021234 RepID=A0A2P1PT88_9GAMM|nr:histone deacetylase family protein [Ahniella affigens]AVP98030.1 acetoin utilization protein [Ahniella affigens]